MRTTGKRQQVHRRDFLRQISAAGISGLILPRGGLALWPEALSRVAIVDDSAATTGSSINGTVVLAMVNSAVKSLTQTSDVDSAWKTLMPGVSTSSIIALKVNTLFSSFTTHPVVAAAVANSIQQMSFSGTPFPANNIIVYDNLAANLQSAGFVINTSSIGVRCLGTDTAGFGYASTTYSIAGRSQRLSKIITDVAHYLVNIAVLKNHSMCGVTLCMKNHYGTCSDPGNLHDNYCSPYIAALNATAPIVAKQKLNIIDALFGAYSGGPGTVPQFVANRLIVSTDVVATDTLGRKLLIDKGCTNAGDAGYIDLAATTYNLGTNNMSNMDIVNIQNPSGVESLPDLPSQTRLDQNYPNPFNPRTNIRFSLSNGGAVQLTIHDAAGRLVSKLVEADMAAGEHSVVFDGSGCASGTYVATLRVQGGSQSRKMLLMR